MDNQFTVSEANLLQSGNGNVTQFDCPKNSRKFAIGMPDTIIIHYTASEGLDTTTKYLCRNDVKASAHIVVGRNGEVNQLVAFDKQAWHAGKSSYGGRDGYNKFSIGIEIMNAGYLDQEGDRLVSWFKKAYPKSEAVLAMHKNETEARYWHTYTEAQVSVVMELCQALMHHYPSIQEVLGHDDISPGRKQDPGPAFPMQKLRERLLFGRQEEDSNEAQINKAGTVTANQLNFRAAPNATSEKIAPPLPHGKNVKVISEYNGWYKIQAEIEGWVSGRYVDLEG
jgi:N-acetylmuramoyl-L-alanine amidase